MLLDSSKFQRLWLRMPHANLKVKLVLAQTLCECELYQNKCTGAFNANYYPEFIGNVHTLIT